MNIDITKEDLELAVPAAREPKGVVYEMLLDALYAESETVERELLGAVGASCAERGDTGLGSRVQRLTKRLVCVRAFLSEMRGLDLVLTATGFGVVSTQDTAPASKMRVDALEGQLRRRGEELRGELLDALFEVSGWNGQIQRTREVETVFYKVQHLREFAGMSTPGPDEWRKSLPRILTSDSFLRRHIGSVYMDYLLDRLTSASLDSWDGAVVRYLQHDIGATLAGNMLLREEVYSRMISHMERHLDHYVLYAEGEGYRLNHPERSVSNLSYENHAEDSAFHFVG